MTSSVDVSPAFNAMLFSLGIPTDDHDIIAESRVVPPQAPHEAVKLTGRIDDTVNKLSSVLQTITALLANRTAKLNRCRNTMAPRIHQLPLEVFRSIIDQSVARKLYKCKPARLEELRTVCTAWSERIVSDPTLWTTINISDSQNERQLQTLLKRSGTTPLFITPEGYDPYPIMNAVGPHVDRWRTLHHPNHMIADLLSQPTPTLESLHLGAQAVRESDVFENLLGGHSPQLRILKTSYLRTVDICNPAILANLVELALYGEENPTETVPRMIDIVGRCGNLRSLQIYHNTRFLPPHFHVDKITLPTLETLELKGPLRLLTTVLNNVVAPGVRSLRIQEGDLKAEQEDVDVFLKAGLGLLNKIPETTIQVTNTAISLHPYGDSAVPEVTIAIRSIRGIAAATKIIQCRNSNVVRVEVEPKVSFVSSLIDQVAKDLPQVREFALQDERHKTALHALALARGPGSILPSLKRLEVWEEGGWVDKLEEFTSNVAADRPRGGSKRTPEPFALPTTHE